MQKSGRAGGHMAFNASATDDLYCKMDETAIYDNPFGYLIGKCDLRLAGFNNAEAANDRTDRPGLI
jgi:hypothetical protein